MPPLRNPMVPPATYNPSCASRSGPAMRSCKEYLKILYIASNFAAIIASLPLDYCPSICARRISLSRQLTIGYTAGVVGTCTFVVLSMLAVVVNAKNTRAADTENGNQKSYFNSFLTIENSILLGMASTALCATLFASQKIFGENAPTTNQEKRLIVLSIACFNEFMTRSQPYKSCIDRI